MIDYGKIRLNQDVHDSLVFYFMLSTYLTANGVSEENAMLSLNEFTKECRRTGVFKNSQVESAYYSAAYSCLPTSFLNLLGVESKLNDGIKVIDTSYGWVNKL